MKHVGGPIREQVNRLGRPSIGMLGKEIGRLERRESLRRLMVRCLMSIVIVAAVIVLITNLWVSVLQVDKSSMNPLFQKGDIVLSVECDEPVRNDIIVFNQDNKLCMKRVIAVAGDKVEIDNEGVVSVNGEVLDEPYVTKLSLGNSDITFPYAVPPGTVFVLGDNREISSDSRNSQFGPVDTERIVGKAIFTVWPISRAKKIR